MLEHLEADNHRCRPRRLPVKVPDVHHLGVEPLAPQASTKRGEKSMLTPRLRAPGTSGGTGPGRSRFRRHRRRASASAGRRRTPSAPRASPSRALYTKLVPRARRRDHRRGKHRCTPVAEPHVIDARLVSRLAREPTVQRARTWKVRRVLSRKVDAAGRHRRSARARGARKATLGPPTGTVARVQVDNRGSRPHLRRSLGWNVEGARAESVQPQVKNPHQESGREGKGDGGRRREPDEPEPSESGAGSGRLSQSGPRRQQRTQSERLRTTNARE